MQLSTLGYFLHNIDDNLMYHLHNKGIDSITPNFHIFSRVTPPWASIKHHHHDNRRKHFYPSITHWRKRPRSK